MDNVPELIFTFSSLPPTVRHDILTELSPEKAIRLCNTDRQTKKLCKDDFDVWVERINNECEEYKVLGIDINSNNAYDKYAECKRERKKLSNLERSQRMDLIEQGNLLDFIRSNPDKNIGYFYLACVYGRLNIAKWLYIKFDITDEDAKYNDNAAFSGACTNGHLDVAKWLYSTFKMTNEEAKADDNSAFRLACINGHLEVAKWLHTTVNISAGEAKSFNNLAFRFAYAKGHLDVAKWLHATFHITNQEVRFDNNMVFKHACTRRHLDVARWLDETFDLGLTPDQRSIYEKCL